MHSREILHKHYQFTNTNYQSNHKTIKLQQTQYHDAKVFDTFIEQGGTTLALIVFLSGLLVFVNRKASKLELELDNLFINLENNNYPCDLPCQNCSYFSQNNYLSCAVNPTIVMTEEARNCSDYLFSKK